ncbi:hypothetical protein [Candidatus Propionivibrio aalborgensis]|uniref:hypothetical protein n=1 Tax=Candidatus Propionivibrio aalborgensis TaxID=1860101 RepID=UPI0016447E46|nr:hypothetical protein [Candidatus Propionivibrio aalborgensis]
MGDLNEDGQLNKTKSSGILVKHPQTTDRGTDIEPSHQTINDMPGYCGLGAIRQWQMGKTLWKRADKSAEYRRPFDWSGHRFQDGSQEQRDGLFDRRQFFPKQGLEGAFGLG